MDSNNNINQQTNNAPDQAAANKDVQKKPVNRVRNTIIILSVVSAFIAFAAFGAALLVKYRGDINNSQLPPAETAGEDEGETSELPAGTAWQFNLVKPAFAEYSETTTSIVPKLSAAGIKLDDAENLAGFTDEGVAFSEERKNFLEQNGFVLAANNITEDQTGFQARDDFVDMYDVFDGSSNMYYRDPSDAIFITSDLALHLYHLLIDRSFQRIEETKFQPMLRSMTKALFLDSIGKYNTAQDSALKDSYQRLAVYYLIPLIVLDAGSESAGAELKPEDFDTFAQFLEAESNQTIKNSVEDLNFALNDKQYGEIALDDGIYELVKAELALIKEAKGLANSPLFTPYRPEFKNDYSQFKPRSHYTKNDVLKSYFIAMMWYGRMGFTLNSPELTRDALLITGQINNLDMAGGKLSQTWSDMMTVIDFFVGEVDDLTAFQYSGIIKKVYGDSVKEEQFVDENKLAAFKQTAVRELPLPRILSEAIMMEDYDSQTKEELLAATMQFRFMGQRFTPDAYIINKLTQGDEAPDPETGQKLPTMPTALMPIHIISPDNTVVKAYLDEWVNDPERIADQGRESDKVIAKVNKELIAEFAGYDQSVWTQNIYWSWLNCYRPLLDGYSGGYPWFMRGDNWQRKNLGTVLGSYAELKHDTLLYAKQSYAELGGGGENPDEIPPVVKGYVEPDLVFWQRITALAKTTQDGLTSRGVFPEDFTYKFEIFVESSEFFSRLAEEELKNGKINDEDFEKLRTISGQLKRIADPLPGQELTDKEKRAGIIADIHTDVPHNEVLYEATGKPYIIYVLVNDVNGGRLVRGAVFNHYEFADSLDERLSDEDWQARVYGQAKELPAGDKWTMELVK